MFAITTLTKNFIRNDQIATVFEDVTFDVRPGEFVSIIGPSGCGKTSLLRCLAGLDTPDAGTIRLDGRIVDGPGANVVMVFQNAANSLFPWKTVLGNVVFGATRCALSRAEAEERAQGLVILNNQAFPARQLKMRHP